MAEDPAVPNGTTLTQVYIYRVILGTIVAFQPVLIAIGSYGVMTVNRMGAQIEILSQQIQTTNLQVAVMGEQIKATARLEKQLTDISERINSLLVASNLEKAELRAQLAKLSEQVARIEGGRASPANKP